MSFGLFIPSLSVASRPQLCSNFSDILIPRLAPLFFFVPSVYTLHVTTVLGLPDSRFPILNSQFTTCYSLISVRTHPQHMRAIITSYVIFRQDERPMLSKVRCRCCSFNVFFFIAIAVCCLLSTGNIHGCAFFMLCFGVLRVVVEVGVGVEVVEPC